MVMFSNSKKLECNDNSKFSTRVFYCEPVHPKQKSVCESSHELIEKVFLQGFSVYCLPQ